MKTTTLLGVGAIILAYVTTEHLFGRQPGKRPGTTGEKGNGEKVPFLTRNDQYRGPGLPGTKNYPTASSAGRKCP